MISQAFDVYNVKYTATPVPLHLGGLNVLNVFAMSGYI